MGGLFILKMLCTLHIQIICMICRSMTHRLIANKVYLPYLWRPDNLCTPRRTSTITIIIATSGKLDNRVNIRGCYTTKNRLLQVMVTQTLSVILFSEQKLTHFTNISCEIQQNVVELIKHLSKHLPLRFNLATNEIRLTKFPLNPAQCYTERFHQTKPFRSLILSTLITT